MAIRAILKQKWFTLINISGLAIGLAASLLITLWVQDELSYDKEYLNSDRIFLVGLDAKLGNQEFKAPSTPIPLAFTMVDEFDQVEQATRYIQRSQTIVKYEETIFSEDRFFYADSTFFDVFDFPFIYGDPASCLDQPNTVVLTRSMSEKYFGERNPIGTSLRINNSFDLEVTAVCENPPNNTHIKFDFLGSFPSIRNQYNNHDDWGSSNVTTFVLLHEGYRPNDTEADFKRILDTYFGPIITAFMNITLDEFYEAGNRYYFFLESLQDIHLRSQMTENFEGSSKMSNVYTLSLIALFILIIACINFINLSTAKSSQKAREVGVRKVLGSNRWLLIRQFLSESLVLSILGMAVACLLVELFITRFNTLTNKVLDFNLIGNPGLLTFTIGLTIFTGVVAGSYAAFIQSSFSIFEVLKGTYTTGSRSGIVRNGLVILQFSISIFLIVCTLTVFSQIRYIQNKDMGFNTEDVLIINKFDELENQQYAFKQQVMNIPGVISSSVSRNIPGRGFSGTGILKEGGSDGEVHVLGRFHADTDILSTLDINLKEGRFFSPGRPADSVALVINESAASSMGLTDPLNQRLLESGDTNEVRPIIGVVKDFHFSTLHDIIRPLAFEIIPSQQSGNYLVIRYSTAEIQQIIRSTEDIWNNMVSDIPFDYTFMKEDFFRHYNQEQKLGIVFSIFSILAIFIACLGLFALSAYLTEQKTKDIGIRKAMGASVPSIVIHLTREFTKWVVLANIVAWPAAYFLMKNWLQNFAFRVDLNILFFIVAALATLVVAIFTVLFQSVRAAVRNPSESLRYE